MKQVTRYIDSIKSDITFTIGGNAQENFDIIDASNPNDIWFHIDGFPSEHVIAGIPEGLDTDKKKMAKIATQGAVLCKQHSKYASQKNLRIVYTRVNDLMKTEKIGCVIALNQKIIVI
jgi:predicted ribosome quality control (RQC) complex YloA/Tae2 family protein